MPYTEKQNKLFRAAEHNPKIAKSAGIPQSTAKKLANEGVKKPSKPAKEPVLVIAVKVTPKKGKK